MLKVNHIQKTYSHFHLDCSLEIQPGSITGIIGKNGHYWNNRKKWFRKNYTF